MAVNSNKTRCVFRCLNCKSIFVDPLPNEKELSLYYEDYALAGIGSSSWHRRKSLPVILELTNNIKKGKVLDIGCGNGKLLDLLPANLEKYGVELSETGFQKLVSKGIKVCCASWESAEFETNFDLIIALDFIEHVHNPREAIVKMSETLNPGGYILVETGNADSWPARILGNSWCYPSIFGHLAVLSASALVDLAEKAQLETIAIIKGHHSFVPAKQLLYRNFLGFGFRLYRLIYSWVTPLGEKIPFLRQLADRPPPGAPLPDHMIYVGRKKPCIP